MIPTRTVLAVLALSLASAAEASTQVYDVDPAYRQEVLHVLRTLLHETEQGFSNPNLYGRVELLPTGQIVVDTLTDERQAQVASVLDAIARSRPGATPTITLRYWALRGVPGGEDAPDLPAGLAGVARELEAVHGDLGIKIVDAATVTGQSGRPASFGNSQAGDGRWQIVQVPNANANRLNASISIAHGMQELNVEVALTPGQFLVLGGGTTGGATDSGDVDAFVVNWPGAE
jgi:hypothetical protein